MQGFIHDYVLNGRGHGAIAETMGAIRWDAGMLRPYFNEKGLPCVNILTGRWTTDRGVRRAVREEVSINSPRNNRGQFNQVLNATTLRKEQWIEYDRVILKAARYRLRAWEDLEAASSFGGFDGMNKMLLEHETMSDPMEAIQDMEGTSEGRSDTPTFQLEGLPLPITHVDFSFGARRLGISQSSNTPLDMVAGEASGYRIGETIEKTTIGNMTGVVYGGNSTQTGGYGRTSQVYGYLNFPARITSTTMTAPTAGGWVPATTITEVLALRDKLVAAKKYGPFMIYHSTDWDQYMDKDYILTGGNVATQTLRARLLAIGKEDNGAGGQQAQIAGVRRLDMLFASAPITDASKIQTGTKANDYLGPGVENLVSGGGGTGGAWPFTLIVVQMTPENARAVNGMDITTLQWPTMGGMKLNFRVMCIKVPQLRADRYGNCGILVSTTA
jgi:hypothetical protein